jgi:tRNA uridine 5-carboxymethylaminomethyl modification enzyme
MDKSLLFSENENFNGPRYCPSIEDKIKRFPDKEEHQIFVEYESEESSNLYLAGFSTSMPNEIQDKMVKTLPGFKNATILEYGYAIEYDAINPIQLFPSLESKIIKNLFFAGQINGTSGYEEAAAQGLIAGVNARNLIEAKEPLIINRNEGYIGVLIDDITSKGVLDPYRLLTSRAEYRLLLRSDNALERLYSKSIENNLLSFDDSKIFKSILEKQSDLKTIILTNRIKLTDLDPYVSTKFLNTNSIYLSELIKRTDIEQDIIIDILDSYFNDDIIKYDEYLNIINDIRFDGYIKRQEKDIKNYLRHQESKIPMDINFSNINNLAAEAVEKLEVFKPTTIYQASSIIGINPTDILILVKYIKENYGK